MDKFKKSELLKALDEAFKKDFASGLNAVSYTHLTLPTTERV